MTKKLLIGASAIWLLLGVASVRPALGESLDQYAIVHLTFSGSIRLPGVTIAAGTYTFKRVGPAMIQVLSRDRRTSFGVFMTIPALRAERSSTQEVVFGKAPVGEPPPLDEWFPVREPSAFSQIRTPGFAFRYAREPGSDAR